MATQNSEDYLRCIFKLQTDAADVPTSRIAAAMGVTQPSVTDMIQRLAGDGLLQYKRYGGVRLTKEGMKIALRVTRRHRLWEMFLVRILDFTWDEVDGIANLLEHATPPELEARIDALLGYPTVDPHGEPIPTKDGVVTEPANIPLSYMQANQSATVVRVRDNPDALKQLSSLGIGLKKRLRVISVAPFDGSMSVRIGSKDAFLSKELASNVFVQPEKPEKTVKHGERKR
ncbi:MAG TPA: metal-dependent transcriptional regulator [Candidatus Kapabacteria bacterium]|nr:metal-dependent transcriptional regulator [Candidatus Kapabacteria bacterium]